MFRMLLTTSHRTGNTTYNHCVNYRLHLFNFLVFKETKWKLE